MRTLFLIFIFIATVYADKDGNGKCWQREKIQELQNIKNSKIHTEYGTVSKGVDDFDYYYFTPNIDSKFEMIFTSNEKVNLLVGVACDDGSILDESSDTEFVVLDQDIKETIHILVKAQSRKLTSYKIYVNLSLKDDNSTKRDYNSNYGSHFNCTLINGNVTCKR